MMKYKVNPSEYINLFGCPKSVVDEHIKLCSLLQLQSFLLLANGKDVEEISKILNVQENYVCDALDFWVQRGVLLNDEEKIETQPQPAENPDKPHIVKVKSIPTSQEATLRCSQDERLKLMIDETQRILNRIISMSELSTLIWLHDDQGLEPEVILMAVQYASEQKIKGFKYIENMCIGWANEGISTVKQANDKINELYLRNSAWCLVESAFGIPHRKATKKEDEFSNRWVNEWEFNKSMLEKAYDKCIDSTGKIAFPYINKILAKWHESGFKKPEDIVETKKEEPKQNNKSYSIDKIHKKLNNFK